MSDAPIDLQQLASRVAEQAGPGEQVDVMVGHGRSTSVKVFGGEVALNAWVIRPGAIEIGDLVRVIPCPQQSVPVGGWIVGAPYPRLSSG